MTESGRETIEESADSFPVVGIGASAGGLSAFQQFLEAVPSDSGMAFVLIQHLDPDHESLMASLLSKASSMPVVEARDATPLEPNHVYVIPPNRYLAVRDGGLFLEAPIERRGMRMPIDHFFRSLARARAERAICIVLSGTGSDGAAGLREVKAAGGMAMVQDPETAEYEGMPRSAVATKLVDFSLSIAEMPAVLARYVGQPYVEQSAEPALDRAEPDSFLSILHLLRSHTNHDFRCYEKATLDRRIQRRMGLRHVRSTADYLEVLRADSAEVQQLFRDLSIGVTRFFRDDECWLALEEVLEGLVAERAEQSDPDPIRIWVPGCSTGEEAYSLAILLLECLDEEQRRIPLHVFGTDLDPDSIHTARTGRYPESICEDVSAARLRRFFREENGAYVVAKPLRDVSIFAPQNLTAEPPFSRLDLISCRNVMIHLESEVQQRLLRMFHFALRPGGTLVVGPCESVNRPEHLFELRSKAYKIYRRLEGRRSRPAMWQVSAAARATREGGEEPATPPSHGQPAALAKRLLVENYAPASVLVDGHYRTLFLHGKLRDYLDFPAGEASHDLTKLALPGLRTKVRSALQQATQRQEKVVVVVPRFRRNGTAVNVAVTVVPGSANGEEQVFLVSFADVSGAADAAPPSPVEETADDEPLVEQLQYELQAVREDLQSTIEELETANGKLQASSEEVMSMNEELQSTNEELGTSKEELQSLNEELSTVNSQLEEKVEELESTNDDLSNLLSSTAIATIFLDRELRIRRFTPVTTELLSVIGTDLGRPITDLVPRISDPELVEDAREVLEHLTPIEREVGKGGARAFLRRVLPYRTSDDRIEGVVVTYTNVSDLRSARLRAETRERQQAIIAQLGQKALVTDNLQDLLDAAVGDVAHGMDAEFCKVLRLLPDRREFLLMAAVGFERAKVGETRVGASLDSQAGFTLQSTRPVVVTDLGQERRFSGPPLLHEHGVVSGISVLIGTPSEPWGVLGVHTRQARELTTDDIHFMEGVANVLAGGIDTVRYEEQLRRRAHEMSLLFQATSSVTSTLSEALQSCIDAVCDITDYPIGHAYVPAPNKRKLVSSKIWRIADEARTDELRRLSDEATFRLGEGFVGRIWKQRIPIVVEDLTKDPGFVRSRLGSEAAVRGAFGFPVVVGDEVVAVLEFFSYSPVSSDEQPLDVVQSLGTQVGRVFERNRARKALREGAERLTLALEAGGLGAWDWDLATDVMTWTPEVDRMLGLDPDESAPSYGTWVARLHPDDRDRAEEAVRATLDEGAPFRSEYRIVRPDGTVRWLEGRGTCRGEPDRLRMYGVVMDVTERREKDAELRQAGRRKDAFLAALGHELRNPLNAVANGALLLQARSEGGELAETSEMIVRQVQLMTNLLNDLLDVGRIARGSIELDRHQVSVAEHVERALETVEPVVEAKQHAVSISIDPEDLQVVADPVRFEQIIVNLLSNAARYTPEGGSIEVSARAHERGVRLTVSDSGIGLAVAGREELFEPFVQATKGSGGLGIGLSIVRDLVELHGGRVGVKSDGPGRGSSFFLTLPADVELSRDEPETAAEPPETTGLGSLRVLIVDDHEESLEALAALLSRHCKVATATTGSAAIAEANRFEPDVVLLDLALPDMSGFDVAGRLAENPTHEGVIRIAVTGFGDNQTEAETSEAGFHEHVMKPVEFQKLLEILQRVATARSG